MFSSDALDLSLNFFDPRELTPPDNKVKPCTSPTPIVTQEVKTEVTPDNFINQLITSAGK
jgi:hypothetical protein